MSRDEVRFFVAGHPVAQGSKNAYIRGGRAVLVETSKKLPTWRKTIAAAAQQSGVTYPKGTPVELTVEFVMPRTKAMRSKPAPPMVQKPDTDKLLRAVGDALTASGMIHDDSQLVTIHAHKRRAQVGENTGCWLHTRPNTTTPSPSVQSHTPTP